MPLPTVTIPSPEIGNITYKSLNQLPHVMLPNTLSIMADQKVFIPFLKIGNTTYKDITDLGLDKHGYLKGKGGSGRIFFATQLPSNTEVVIKVMQIIEEQKEHLLNEINITGEVYKVFDVGKNEQYIFMVMPKIKRENVLDFMYKREIR